MPPPKDDGLPPGNANPPVLPSRVNSALKIPAVQSIRENAYTARQPAIQVERAIPRTRAREAAPGWRGNARGIARSTLYCIDGRQLWMAPHRFFLCLSAIKDLDYTNSRGIGGRDQAYFLTIRSWLRLGEAFCLSADAFVL